MASEWPKSSTCTTGLSFITRDGSLQAETSARSPVPSAQSSPCPSQMAFVLPDARTDLGLAVHKSMQDWIRHIW